MPEETHTEIPKFIRDAWQLTPERTKGLIESLKAALGKRSVHGELKPSAQVPVVSENEAPVKPAESKPPGASLDQDINQVTQEKFGRSFLIHVDSIAQEDRDAYGKILSIRADLELMRSGKVPFESPKYWALIDNLITQELSLSEFAKTEAHKKRTTGTLPVLPQSPSGKRRTQQ